MKKRLQNKILAFILAVAVVVTLTPSVAFMGNGEVHAAGNVAKIGDTEYATLQDAVDSIKTNDQTEIVLIGDVSEQTRIEVDDYNLDVVIDLNSHSISNTLRNYENLTIEDSGASSSWGCVDFNVTGSKIIVNNGNLTLLSGRFGSINNNNSKSFVVRGGMYTYQLTTEITDDYACEDMGSAAGTYRYEVVKATNVTLDNDGGTPASDTVKESYGYPLKSITVPTKAASNFAGYYYDLDGTNEKKYYNADGSSAVSTWDIENSEATLTAKWTQKAKYTIGENEYESLQSALDAAKDGDIITMNANDELDANVLANLGNKSVVIDMQDDFELTLGPTGYNNIQFIVSSGSVEFRNANIFDAQSKQNQNRQMLVAQPGATITCSSGHFGGSFVEEAATESKPAGQVNITGGYYLYTQMEEYVDTENYSIDKMTEKVGINNYYYVTNKNTHVASIKGKRGSSIVCVGD